MFVTEGKLKINNVDVESINFSRIFLFIDNVLILKKTYNHNITLFWNSRGKKWSDSKFKSLFDEILWTIYKLKIHNFDTDQKFFMRFLPVHRKLYVDAAFLVRSRCVLGAFKPFSLLWSQPKTYTNVLNTNGTITGNKQTGQQNSNCGGD